MLKKSQKYIARPIHPRSQHTWIFAQYSIQGTMAYGANMNDNRKTDLMAVGYICVYVSVGVTNFLKYLPINKNVYFQ